MSEFMIFFSYFSFYCFADSLVLSAKISLVLCLREAPVEPGYMWAGSGGEPGVDATKRIGDPPAG
jgi:hypothetical protein